ncbi:MAG: hypothetical protein ABUL58_00195 [Steroidobacter sp.]
MTVGAALDWRQLAERHRPQSDDLIRLEALRLHREQNLSAQDIHVALRLPLEMVMEWLAQ